MVNLYNYHVFGFTLSRENVLKWFWVNLPLNIPEKQFSSCSNDHFLMIPTTNPWFIVIRYAYYTWSCKFFYNDHLDLLKLKLVSLFGPPVFTKSSFWVLQIGFFIFLPWQIFLKNWISFSMHVEDDPVFRFGHWVFTKSIYWRPPKMGFLIKYL